MTILGVQLVFTIAMASVMQRLTKHVSFGQWLICTKLVRYLSPSDDDLKRAAGLVDSTKSNKVRRRKENDQQQQNEFTIPKSTDVCLESSPLTPIDCLPLKYYADYQWLVDLSLCALVVYLFSEVYIACIPAASREMNLSLIWCLFVIVSILRLKTTLTSQYFRSDDYAEGILCCIFGFFFLVLSMGLLVMTEDVLDLGLERAHADLTKNAQEFLERRGMNSDGPFSVHTFKLILAFCSAMVGLVMTFPGIRFARMHADAVRHAQGQPLQLLLLYTNLLAPLLLVLLWIKPVVFDRITRPTGLRPALMTEDTFFTFRLWSVVAFCLFRFLMTRTHLQAHLNLAADRAQQIKREAGRISNVDFQKRIIHIHYYLCVVALQYLLPVLLLLFTCFCMKTMGGLSWNGNPVASSVANSTVNPSTATLGAAHQAALSLAQLQAVFTKTWYHGLFSYFSFWILVSWSTTSLFGIVYHAQFIS